MENPLRHVRPDESVIPAALADAIRAQRYAEAVRAGFAVKSDRLVSGAEIVTITRTAWREPDQAKMKQLMREELRLGFDGPRTARSPLKAIFPRHLSHLKSVLAQVLKSSWFAKFRSDAVIPPKACPGRSICAQAQSEARAVQQLDRREN